MERFATTVEADKEGTKAVVNQVAQGHAQEIGAIKQRMEDMEKKVQEMSSSRQLGASRPEGQSSSKGMTGFLETKRTIPKKFEGALKDWFRKEGRCGNHVYGSGKYWRAGRISRKCYD